MYMRPIYLPVIGICLAVALQAQLVQPGNPIPHTSKPPVVFLNGYQNDCSSATFAATFGTADQVLQANGEASVFFNNCSVSGKPTIEELGADFGTFLAGLKYDDGQPVIIVDAVAHSMGGLILRSYLSGKQPNAATFQPPAQTKLRKVVFLATPHFGWVSRRCSGWTSRRTNWRAAVRSFSISGPGIKERRTCEAWMRWHSSVTAEQAPARSGPISLASTMAWSRSPADR